MLGGEALVGGRRPTRTFKGSDEVSERFPPAGKRKRSYPRRELPLTREDGSSPDAGRITFQEWSVRWIDNRFDIKIGTRYQYESLLKNHLIPAFGPVPMANISVGMIRTWHAALAREKPGAASSAYRLLRVIFSTAVEDGIIIKSPCKIKGAGRDTAERRQIPTLAEVAELARAMPPNLAAAVSLAAWGTLRVGEILGLQRRDLDFATGSVRVERAMKELRKADGGFSYVSPKSGAGVRVVHLPESVMETLSAHFEAFVGPSADAPLFTGTTGQPLRPRGLAEAWREARATVGVVHLHFHDLRHFSATMAAANGASMAELKARGGWADDRMVLRYQHSDR